MQPVQPFSLSDPVAVFGVVLLAIATAPVLAKLFRISVLVVLLVLGMLLGSNVTGVLTRDAQLILLEKIGLLYIMLLAGLNIDLTQFRRLGVRSLVFGSLTFGLPFLAGIVSGKWLTTDVLSSIFLGILYSPHTLISYPIIAQLGLVKNEAIAVALGGTVVTSILTLSGFSAIQSLAGGSMNLFFWIKLFLLFPLFILLTVGIVRKLSSVCLRLPLTASLMPEFIFILTCLFVVASATPLLGIDPIVGGFVAGLALNPAVANYPVLLERVEFVGNSLFIPSFLISVGILCNPRVLWNHPENVGLALLVVGIAVGSKLFAAGIAGWFYRYSFSEIMVMWGLTLSRAALVLVIALFGRQSNFLSEGLFNAVILYILITCLIGPSLVETFAQNVAPDLD
jgi:Kef-type K+ transport system membrane component KefB